MTAKTAPKKIETRKFDEKKFIDLEMPHYIKAYGQFIEISSERTYPIYTYGFVKPHAFEKKDEIMGCIYDLSSKSGTPLHVISEKTYTMPKIEAQKHYTEHRFKPFFTDLVEMVTEGMSHHFILAGNNAIRAFRDIVGKTMDPAPGTLRAMFGEYEKRLDYNAIHASDSLESFVNEVELHFTKKELRGMGEQFWKRLQVYKEWAA
jgi:nucleoside-diphosphate kinase